MKNPKIFDDKCSLSRPFSRINVIPFQDKTYLTGDVVTPDGIVSVYSQGGPESFYHTRLDVAHKGKMYMRNIEKRYSAQYLVTLANRFAKEVCK